MYIELKTDRLLLRPLNVLDLHTTNEYSTDYNNTKYMFYLPNKGVEETYDFLICVSAEWQKENPSFYEFAILFNNIHIGAVSVYLNEDKTEGELGWIIDKKYWGNGFATEAALAIKAFAISRLKLKKLVAHCDCRNITSAHVMKKIGLTFESKCERRYFDERGLADEFNFSCELSE